VSSEPDDREEEEDEQLRPPSFSAAASSPPIAPTPQPLTPPSGESEAYPYSFDNKDEDDGEDYVIQPPGPPPAYKQPRVFVPALIVLVLLLWFLVPSLSGKKKPPATGGQSTVTQTTTSTSSSKSTSTSPAKTTTSGQVAKRQATFVARGDTVCSQERHSFVSLDRRYRSAKTLTRQAAYLTAGAALFARSQHRLQGLKPPRAKAAGYRSWLKTSTRELTLMRREAASLRQRHVAAANRLDSQVAQLSKHASLLARRLGFKVCGH
jgi:hypothetical protein